MLYTLAYRSPAEMRFTSVFFRRLDVNAVRRTRRRAQKAAHALLQPAFVAVQHVDPAIARLKMHLFVRIILRNRFAEYIAECNAKTLRQRAERFSYFPKS